MKQVTKRKRCPICKDGELVSTGMALTSNPPWYVHKCDKCFVSAHERNNYPMTYIEYEEHEKREDWE